jgi:hypothetical protein
VNLPAIFLRIGAVLPDNVGFVQTSFCEGWMAVEATTANTMDTAIRQAGWHFVWLVESAAGMAAGLSEAAACNHAAALALNRIHARFNAAELGPVRVTKYPGFYVAKVTLHTRQIQQQTSLGLVDEMLLREVLV